MSIKKIIGMDVFAGAGGLSLGAKLAGISVQYAIEKDRYAAQTYSVNHCQTVMINSDICDFNEIPTDLLNADATILFGGAPCQGFSSSNRRTNNRKNNDNWLYKEFIRISALWYPDWIVFENVTGIVEMESGWFLNEVLEEFAQVGYNCMHCVLNARDVGVPQNRSRLFIIGSKHGKNIDFTSWRNEKNNVVSVRDAFYDLPLLANGARVDTLAYRYETDNDYATRMRDGLKTCSGNLVTKNADYVIERYKHIKQGENWSSIPHELMNNYSDFTRCHTGIYRRLNEDIPSVVVGNYRKNMLIHPWCDRGLSVREAARLQSFPDNYIFKGTIGFQQQQVGNAVPPLLAKQVFDKILEQV